MPLEAQRLSTVSRSFETVRMTPPMMVALVFLYRPSARKFNSADAEILTHPQPGFRMFHDLTDQGYIAFKKGIIGLFVKPPLDTVVPTVWREVSGEHQAGD